MTKDIKYLKTFEFLISIMLPFFNDALSGSVAPIAAK